MTVIRTNKCCMGFLFFLVEIHLVYLYNTGKGKQLGGVTITTSSCDSNYKTSI